MLELRSRGREVVKRLQRGERLALTYRGKKVATLVPEEAGAPLPPDDPIRKLHELAEPLGSMSNEEMDQLLYGEPKDIC